jgi:hypothetical protein
MISSSEALQLAKRCFEEKYPGASGDFVATPAESFEGEWIVTFWLKGPPIFGGMLFVRINKITGACWVGSGE